MGTMFVIVVLSLLSLMSFTNLLPLNLYALSGVGVVFLSHAPENYRCLSVSHGPRQEGGLMQEI